MLGLFENWRYLGTPAPLSHVWTCGLLRLFKEQARHQAFPRDQPSDHSVLPAWRGLGLVLHRSGDARACLIDSCPWRLAGICSSSHVTWQYVRTLAVSRRLLRAAYAAVCVERRRSL